MTLTFTCSAYKTAHSSEADQLLAERGRIDSSHRMTDDILMCVDYHTFMYSTLKHLSKYVPLCSIGKLRRLELSLVASGLQFLA